MVEQMSSYGFHIFQLILCGSNLEAVYDKVVPMRLLPTEYLPDDYTGPTNGSLKDIISKGSFALGDDDFILICRHEWVTWIPM